MSEQAMAVLAEVRKMADRELLAMGRQLSEVLGGQLRRQSWELGRALDGLPPIGDVAQLRARLVEEEWKA